MPARSTSLWDYDQISDLDYLKDRNIYRETITKTRAEHLQEKIAKHKPNVSFVQPGQKTLRLVQKHNFSTRAEAIEKSNCP